MNALTIKINKGRKREGGREGGGKEGRKEGSNTHTHIYSWCPTGIPLLLKYSKMGVIPLIK